ncbi:Flavoprotein-like domain [Phytophthora cactorum]|nr:Flavoprotein-like domain [Phytophthora cactorum]
MAPLESKFDKKQTILHINASLTPNSVTDRVAAKMIEHLTHHFHRHICSNNGPLGQAEKDILNIEECDVWRCLSSTATLCTYMEARHGSEDEADIETFRPMKELAKQMLRAPVWNFSVPYVLKQYIDCVLQAGLAFHDKDEEGRTTGPRRLRVSVPLSNILAMCGFGDAHRVAIEGLAKNDKEEYFQNAINKANSIADNVVQSHKLSLDRNCG